MIYYLALYAVLNDHTARTSMSGAPQAISSSSEYKKSGSSRTGRTVLIPRSTANACGQL